MAVTGRLAGALEVPLGAQKTRGPCLCTLDVSEAQNWVRPGAGQWADRCPLSSMNLLGGLYLSAPEAALQHQQGTTFLGALSLCFAF